MLKMCWVWILLSMPGYVSAQALVTRSDAAPKALKAYEQALNYSKASRWKEALQQLETALRLEPVFVDAHFLRAAVYYDQAAFAEAEKNYVSALQLAPDHDPKAWYALAMSQWRQEKFAEAAMHFERFLSGGVRNAALQERAQRYLVNARFAAEAVKNPVPFAPRPLDGGVNTAAPESLPSLRADGQVLVFTRLVGGQEDFYYSERQPDGRWGEAVPVEGINTPFNEGAQRISADGQTMVFNACNTPDGLGSCDLYWSEWREGRWQRPQPMGAPVNTKWMERQPSLSADGRVLLFSSDRPGGYGGRDIWLSYRDNSDNWSEPGNLGGVINTAGNEDCPFLHADGQTLYFMSDGHPGMGGFDLFLSRLGLDGRFSEPLNLGYPINTTANEGALMVSLDGSTAYYTAVVEASPASRFPSTDIMQFSLPAALGPKPVTYVQARVRDAVDGRPLLAEVSLYAFPDDRLVQRRTAEAILYCLPAGLNYRLEASLEGYLFHSAHFRLDSMAGVGSPYVLDIALQPVAGSVAAMPVVLQNIFFETGSAVLLPESKPELERLKRLLTDNPDLRVQINGHTDDVGLASDNQRLSEQRAKAVYDYLLRAGIAAARLRYRGFGESRPLVPNEGAENRQQNRRTEFEVF